VSGAIEKGLTFWARAPKQNRGYNFEWNKYEALCDEARAELAEKDARIEATKKGECGHNWDRREWDGCPVCAMMRGVATRCADYEAKIARLMAALAHVVKCRSWAEVSDAQAEARQALSGTPTTKPQTAYEASCDWMTENWEDIERAILTLFNMPGSPLGEAKAAKMLGLDLITFNERAKALSGTPTTKRWRCESCGERFDVETFSHARGEDDGHGNPVQVECGPVSEEATPTTAKLVPVERLREIDIALRHGHECAQEDLQLTIDYVGSLLREEKI
jgi:hypothetical protein